MADDPNDTRHCPLGGRCESCGAYGPALRVAARMVLGATLCLTLCARCADDGRLPNIQLSTAVKFVAQHDAHLRAADRDGGDGATRVHPLGVRLDC
jgi:hypothetical protein